MKKQEIKNLEELKKISFEIAKGFNIPQVVLLEGPLAVGKTQMVSFMAEALGFPKEEVCSPTFSLINLYKNDKKTACYHIDLYRLKTQKEIESTSFWDIFYEQAYVFIEWPQLVKDKLPPSWNKLFIELSFNKNSDSRILYLKNE